MRYIVAIIFIPIAVFICYFVGFMLDSMYRNSNKKPDPDTSKLKNRISYFVWCIVLGLVVLSIVFFIVKKLSFLSSPDYEPYQ